MVSTLKDTGHTPGALMGNGRTFGRGAGSVAGRIQSRREAGLDLGSGFQKDREWGRGPWPRLQPRRRLLTSLPGHWEPREMQHDCAPSGLCRAKEPDSPNLRSRANLS